jgi:hypothetical protein
MAKKSTSEYVNPLGLNVEKSMWKIFFHLRRLTFGIICKGLALLMIGPLLDQILSHLNPIHPLPEGT